MFSSLFMTTLNFLQGLTGSYAWAIIIFTVIIKVLLYPATQKQYRSMKEMQAIQPEVKRLQEKYKDDQKRLQEEQMKLFARHKINPLGGCFPVLIQMPILYGIYTTIMSFKYVFEGEHTHFLWIGGYLGERWPDIFARNLASPDIPLLLLYGVSMYLSQKLTVTDPATAKQQATMNIVMPVMFTWMLWSWHFPSAMVLYWLMFNLLGLIQQAHIIRMPATIALPPQGASRLTTGRDSKAAVSSGTRQGEPALREPAMREEMPTFDRSADQAKKRKPPDAPA